MRLLLVLAATVAAGLAAAPPAGKLHSRTLSIGGVGIEPQFVLNISAQGRLGTVVVKNDAGVELQTLTCDLFRDWGPQIAVTPDMTADIIDYHARQFVSSVKAADLDFDGLPDILAVRDFSMKTYNYCVWLFDPNSTRFVGNALSHQMEDLVNLTAETAGRLIVSYTIGPTFPSRDEYRIVGRAGPWAREARLLPLRSCVLDTGVTAEADRTAIVTRFVDGREVVQRRRVSHNCEDVCGDRCSTVRAP